MLTKLESVEPGAPVATPEVVPVQVAVVEVVAADAKLVDYVTLD